MLYVYKDVFLEARAVLIRLAEDSLSENIVDCMGGDIVAIDLRVAVEFVGVSFELLTSVCRKVLLSSMVDTEWALLLDRLTVRLSLELLRRVEEILVENPPSCNCEIVVIETGSAVDIPLEFDMALVIEKRVIIEISRVSLVVLYQVWNPDVSRGLLDVRYFMEEVTVDSRVFSGCEDILFGVS